MTDNADLWIPGTLANPVQGRSLNSVLSIAAARLNDKLEGVGSALAQALMAPGDALMGRYDQLPVYEDGRLGMFDPRMMEDAANLAGLVSLGAAPIPRPTNSVGSGGTTLNNLLQEVRKRRADREVELNTILDSQSSSVQFSGSNGSALAGPDMSVPGKFRVTYFDQEGIPNGHSELDSFSEAIDQVLREGYRPISRGSR